MAVAATMGMTLLVMITAVARSGLTVTTQTSVPAAEGSTMGCNGTAMPTGSMMALWIGTDMYVGGRGGEGGSARPVALCIGVGSRVM